MSILSASHQIHSGALSGVCRGVALKNHQDKDGNTPTHIALYNQNMDLFLALLKSGVSLIITNNEGVSVTDLIKLKSDHDFWELYKNEQYEMIWSLLSDDKKTRPKPLPNEMDMKFVRERIEKDGSSFLRKKYYVGYNILHLLLENEWQHVLESTEFINLVKTILDILPCLICERDYSGYGKTPLHRFVKSAPEMVNKPFLEMIKNYFERAKEEATTIEELCYDPPWKTKDECGDTPLHMILDLPYEAKWIRCARQIIEFDPTLKSEVNECGENPLHLLSKLHVSHDQLEKDDVWEDVKYMVRALVDAGEIRDEGGLTPFLSAAKEKKLELLQEICNYAFRGESDVDHNDNNFWHLLADMQVRDYTQTRKILCQDLLLNRYRLHSLGDQNKNGDTPVHIAIQNNSFQIAHIFIERLKEEQKLDALYKCDNDGNPPFHLVVGKSNLPFAENFIQSALVNDSKIVCMRNNEGNTALHLAISKGDLKLAQFIIGHAMESSSRVEYVDIVSIPDNEGNTALHLATLKDHFDFAMSLIEGAIYFECSDEILEIPNNQNKTPSDLIGSAQHVPYEFERLIWENSHVMFAMLGVRRLSGVPTGKITDHINTMGVIGGLLATITFTAAFTTPGGLNSENGTPVLMKKAAFKVFMVLDIIALCLSMLVLFSLLWMMNVGHKRIQVVVLDLAVLLLRGAFCATILTFMMGVFVTVYPLSHWIAILTCVLCLLLLFLINSNITTQRIIPSFVILYLLFLKIFAYIKESWRRPKCLTNNQSHQEESENYGQSNQQIASLSSSCEP